MSYKLKHDSVAGFCKRHAAKISDEFFVGKKRISGDALMKITGSKQVNLLVVRSLFSKWQEETARLKSPYFDYSSKAVVKAQQAFMNTLSQNISVARADFEPLLTEGLSNAIFLTYAPLEFLKSEWISSGGAEIKTKKLKEDARYFKVHDEAIKAVLSQLKDKSIAWNKLDTLLSEKIVESTLAYPEPAAFIKQVGASEQEIDRLFEIEAVVEEEEVALPFFEAVLEEEAEEEPIVAEKEPEAPAQNETPEDSAPEQDAEDKPLHEKLLTKKQTLAEKLQKKVLKDIESSLTLNEKFMFINGLFDGDKDRFKEALSDLEASAGFDDAKQKLARYGGDWDMESEEVEALLEVLGRRFDD